MTDRLLKRQCAQRGFTLVELIIFIVVVGVGMVGILQVVNTTVARSADPLVRKQALALADSILEEVLQKAYADPDGTTGESTRATFDDVDDYNGKTQTLFNDWPAGLADYQVAITVDAAASLGSSTAVPAKKITVTVTRGSEAVSLTGYRTNY